MAGLCQRIRLLPGVSLIRRPVGQFTAKDRDLCGGFNANPDVIATHPDNHEQDVRTDEYLLTDLSTEYEHALLPP
jgi:hypothetical protein